MDKISFQNIIVALNQEFRPTDKELLVTIKELIDNLERPISIKKIKEYVDSEWELERR